MKPIEKHAQRVAAELGDGRSEQALAATRQSLITKVADAGAPRRWVLPLGLSAALAATLLLFMAPWRHASVEFWVGDTAVAADEGAALRASLEQPLPIRFAEGSQVALHSKSRARVARASAGQVRVILDEGALVAQVVPNTGVGWQFQAGPYSVAVTGTKLALSWQPATGELEVAIDEGRVTVTGPGGEAAVSAGERLTGKVGEALRLRSANELAPAREEEPRPREPRRLDQHSSWLSLARQGRAEEALAEARRIGVDRLASTSSIAELVALADLTRAARAPEEAERVLVALQRRFPRSPSASLVPFWRGRLEADVRERPAEAAHQFAAYLAANPEGELAQEALGRLIDVQRQAGQGAAAKASAQRYLERHPGGPYASLAARVLRAP
jgi:transmembrane sensor